MYGNKKLNLESRQLLTARQLYELISEEQIIQHYLGIDSLVSGKTIHSPFRDERSPSFSMVYRNGKWNFRDFGNGFRGDVIDLVAASMNLSIPSAINRIQSDLLINNKVTSTLPSSPRTLKEPNPTEFRPLIRSVLPVDIAYWDQFEVKLSTLNFFKVYPLNILFMTNYTGVERDIYCFVKDNIAYCYLMFDKTGKEKYKFYFPTRKKEDPMPRFLGNVTKEQLQGYDQLPPAGDLLVITKSMKDIMVLYEAGVPAVASIGEGIPILDTYIVDLKKRFKNIVSLYDRDRMGKIGALELRRNHNIPAYMYSREDKNKGVKDTADYVKKYSLKNLIKLIQDETIRNQDTAAR